MGCAGDTLTQDGADNSVAESRWSCTLGTATTCELQIEFDDCFDVSYLMISFKNTAGVGARPPTPCPVKTETVLRFAANETTRSVRLPSVDPLDFHESDDATQLSNSFDVQVGYGTVHTDLTSPGTALGAGQRVEIYLDVDDPDNVVVATLPTISTGASFDSTTVA
ncbi:unnamed protein product [Ectocarpus sp. CCAP 1310/34]|nr:unnamed protein product [Ectocarpus sp. CCAP 1310/34]